MSNSKSVSRRKNAGEHWIVWTAILAAIFVLIVVSSVLVIKRSVFLGVSGAKDGFSDAYENACDSTYQQFWETAYNISEESHHVSNDVAISISSVKEKSNLEVLKVSDVVYIISDADDTKSGTTSWLKVNGTGVFTVNLTAAEYLVDNNRHYVLVRIPSPVLDSDNISIDSFESLFYKENKMNFSNSVQNGERLAQAQLNEARQQIQEDFLASENYDKIAKSSAESMIVALIKGLNSDISDLQVNVEFYKTEANMG